MKDDDWFVGPYVRFLIFFLLPFTALCGFTGWLVHSIQYKPIDEVQQVQNYCVVVEPGKSWVKTDTAFRDYKVERKESYLATVWYYSARRGFKKVEPKPICFLGVMALDDEFVVVAFPKGEHGFKRKRLQESTKASWFVPGSLEWRMAQAGIQRDEWIYIWQPGTPKDSGRLMHLI